VGIGILVILSALAVVGHTRAVYVDEIRGMDADLLGFVRPFLVEWIESIGHSFAPSRSVADFLIEFEILDATVSRPFNWWILIAPLWPIVPLASIEAQVILSAAVLNRAGDAIFTNTSGAVAAQWWFADLHSERDKKLEAFRRAFLLLFAEFTIPDAPIVF